MPIIVVFTKLDLLVASLDRSDAKRGESSQEMAEAYFQEKYAEGFEKSTKNTMGQIPYALVASTSASDVTSSVLTSPCSLVAWHFAAAGRYHDEKHIHQGTGSVQGICTRQGTTLLYG